VRDEFRDSHLAPGPGDDGVRFAVEDVADDRSHALLLGVEPVQQRAVVHRLQRGFAFLEAARRGNWIALQVGVQMSQHFHGGAGDVRGYFVGGPPLARADRLGRCLVQGGQERASFAASLNHVGSFSVCGGRVVRSRVGTRRQGERDNPGSTLRVDPRLASPWRAAAVRFAPQQARVHQFSGAT